MTDVKIPRPFRKQGQQIAFDGCDRAQADYFSLAQIQQYGNDRAKEALEMAADTCDSTLYIEGDMTVSKYGPMTHANVEIRKCADAIRALAKEIK